MARSRQRRRKHRGTQAGTIQRRARSTRASQAAPQRVRERRQSQLNRPPSWRSALNRALIAGAVFFAVLLLAFRRPVGEAFALASFMLALYIPMGYAMDSFRYRLMQRRKARQSRNSESG